MPRQPFRDPIPGRALLLSALALGAAIAGNVVLASAAGGYDLLIWLLALVPAFLLAYYRGWRGVAVALAAGMAAISMTEALVELPAIVGSRALFLLSALVVFIAICLGIGWLSEALHHVRREAEDESRETLEWLEAVVDGSRDAIFISDADSRFVLVNEAACELTGYARETLLGMRIPDLHEDADLDAYREFHEGIMEGAAAVTEAPILRRDGRKVATEFNNQRVEIGGRPYMHTVARDITERREAKRESRRTATFLEALLESIHGGILVEDAERRVALINSSFCALFDIDADPEALIGADCREAAAGAAHKVARPEEFCEGIERRVAERSPCNDEEIRFGDGRTVERDYVPIRKADGQLMGHLWHYRDVTERKVREERMRRVQRLESLGEFTGGIAHDFNNLLTVIGTNAELLATHVGGPGDAAEDGPERSEGTELLHELQAGVESATSLIRRLLAFGRKGEVEREPVDLGAAVGEEVEILRRLIRSNVEVELERERGLPPVLADRGAINQILMNLILNAQDAMPSGGSIHIKVEQQKIDESRVPDGDGRQPGSFVSLTVRDTGVGMDPETRQRIFEPFFTTKPRTEGTGLGLAVVHGLVRDHDGWIEVQSEPDQGTTITLYLPVTDRAVKEGRPEEMDGAGPVGDVTVLLVEDDRALRLSTERTLVRLGCRVLAVADGPEALERFGDRSDGVDLVIADWMMPGMTGLELIRQLKERDPSLPAVLASGYSPEKQQFDVSELESVSFLQKPWTMEQLARAIRDGLG